MDGWDGRTERRNNPSDHDNVTRMLVVLETHVKNFHDHMQEDKKNFDFLNKTVFMGLGALGLIELISKFIK